jgi:hypothetical protein
MSKHVDDPLLRNVVYVLRRYYWGAAARGAASGAHLAAGGGTITFRGSSRGGRVGSPRQHGSREHPMSESVP